MAVTRLSARSPLAPEEIAAIRAPFRKATLLPARVEGAEERPLRARARAGGRGAAAASVAVPPSPDAEV